LHQHPHLADDLREFLENREQMQRLAQPLMGGAEVVGHENKEPYEHAMNRQGSIRQGQHDARRTGFGRGSLKNPAGK
jgi:hypothetical protein